MTLSHSSSVMFTSTRSRRMPGVVHEHVQVAEGLDREVDEALRALPVGDAVGVGDGFAAHRVDLVDDLLRGRAVLALAVHVAAEVVDDDLRALRAKSSACSRPMPRPAPVMIATRPSSLPITDPLHRSTRVGRYRNRVTLVPRRTVVPPGGSCARTERAAAEVLDVGDEPDGLQRVARFLHRLAAQIGDLHERRPELTITPTSESRGAMTPAAGSVPMIFPASTVSL